MSNLSALRIYSSQLPLLNVGGNLLDLLNFFKKFNTFRRQNPEVEVHLRQCLSDELSELLERRAGLDDGELAVGDASDVSTIPPYATWSEAYLREELILAIIPLTQAKSVEMLQSIKMTGTHFDRIALEVHVQLFRSAANAMKDKLPVEREIVRIFFNSLKPADFVKHVRQNSDELKVLSVAAAQVLELLPAYAEFAERYETMSKSKTGNTPKYPKKPAPAATPTSTPSSTPAVPPAASSASSPPVAAVTPSGGKPKVTPPSAGSSPPAKDIWSSKMCVGCGHTTNPPHRRHNCPHRGVAGWCANGICRTPITLPGSVCAVSSDGGPLPVGSVANIAGIISPCPKFSTSVPGTVGLDSYSCYSFVDKVVANSLINQGCVVTDLKQPIVGTAAGGAQVKCYRIIDVWLRLGASVDTPVTFKLRCAVSALPGNAAILISWQDILDNGLQRFLPSSPTTSVASCTDVALVHEPAAPEELEEQFEDCTYEYPKFTCPIRPDAVDDGCDFVFDLLPVDDDSEAHSSVPVPCCSVSDASGTGSDSTSWQTLVELLTPPPVSPFPPELRSLILEVFPCIAFVDDHDIVTTAVLLIQYSSVFTAQFPVGGSLLPAMTVDLVDDEVLPTCPAPRRQSPTVQQFISKTVNHLLELGFVAPSTSPYVSPVVVARAPNRDWRFCIDYTSINRVTKRLHFPLPNTKELLSKMQGYVWYAKLDLKKGFHQVSLDPTSAYLSAFMVADGCFQWNVIPFGFQNGPPMFQRLLVTLVLAGLVGTICLVYIDDIIIGGRDVPQLLTNIKLILDRLKQYKLIVNVAKCVLGRHSIEYLGHNLSAEGVCITEARRQGFYQLVPPTDVKRLRSFLGLVNYFRDFIPQYSTISAPLYDLTCKNIKFCWYAEHRSAFETLRTAIIEAPMLYHLDYALPIVLRTDASTYAIGAMLLQPHPGGERVVCCGSKKLSAAATRWSTRDQEAYGIYYFITLFSCYLLGHPFVVETDHRNLAFIMKSTEGRVYRWKIALQQYDFTVVHIAGTTNVVADALSRCVALFREAPDLSMIDPQHLNWIENAHNELVGHMGIAATVNKLRHNGLVWPHMRQDVVQYIQCCATCQKLRVTEASSLAHGATQVIESYEPFEEISIDTLQLPADAEGYSYVLVVICNYSRFVELAASADKSAESWATFLLRIFCRYGAPRYVRSDQGTEFHNAIMDCLCKMFHCTQRFTIGYRPQANGIAERLNREIIRHLRSIVLSNRIRSRWSIGLPLVQRIVNAHDVAATGYAPATIVYGGTVDLDRGLMSEFKPQSGQTLNQYMKRLYDYQNNAIMASQRHLATVMDARIASDKQDIVEIDVGSYVVVSSLDKDVEAKFVSPWKGPYLVKSIDHNNYTLQDLRTMDEKVVDASRLKLFHVRKGVNPLAIAALDVDEDVIQGILDHRTDHPKTKKSYTFLVKFVDLTEVWLPYMEIRNVEALDKYVDDKPLLKKLFKNH